MLRFSVLPVLPIFDDNATYRKFDGTKASYKTTKDIFQQELHDYTITNAIDDGNVLRFHVHYFTPENSPKIKVSGGVKRQAVVEATLDKHDAATNDRRFNAILATSSINHAIEYHELFKKVQQERVAKDESFQRLNIACVFSPPAENNQDVKQLQEDLLQEKVDNQQAPNEKKEALKRIIGDYNRQYETSHSISEFDSYYQDVQQRIKDQQYPNSDHPRQYKIDVVIVVDMLLTGFDSKYLNTLYVDKNLKHHNLIQAFSRTNRVLNQTKPYGNILDFRQQQDAVDEAIELFSGSGDKNRARTIWLVEPALNVIKDFDEAVADVKTFMDNQGLSFSPKEIDNLQGNTAKIEFIDNFKKVQRLKKQLDMYTDLTEKQKESIEKQLPAEQMREFEAKYLKTARELKAKQGKKGEDTNPELQQLDFEFVLFSSALIDYDYIMGLIARYSERKTTKQKMTREQLLGLLDSNSNLMDERDDLVAYIDSLEVGKGLSEEDIRKGYETFKKQKYNRDLEQLANNHGLEAEVLQNFVEDIMDRMIFDGEQLSDLMAKQETGWKARMEKEKALMEDLAPMLKKLAQGREISGLTAYE